MKHKLFGRDGEGYEVKWDTDKGERVHHVRPDMIRRVEGVPQRVDPSGLIGQPESDHTAGSRGEFQGVSSSPNGNNIDSPSNPDDK